jgi:hypothetical protein
MASQQQKQHRREPLRAPKIVDRGPRHIALAHPAEARAMTRILWRPPPKLKRPALATNEQPAQRKNHSAGDPNRKAHRA